MSHLATAWAYRQGIESGPKFVLVALADFADEAGTCYPGQDRIATMTGMHRSSVVRHLKALEAVGLISRMHRQGAKGQRTSDRYVLHLGTNVAESNVADSNVGESNVAPSTGPLSQSAQIQRRTVRQEPSVEPPVEPSGKNSTREPATFAEFYAAYPRKAARPKAVEAYRKALKRASADQILSGAIAYRSDPNRDDTYTAYPSTWLNRDGWDDAPLPSRNGRPVDRQAEILRAEMDRARTADVGALDLYPQIGA